EWPGLPRATSHAWPRGASTGLGRGNPPAGRGAATSGAKRIFRIATIELLAELDHVAERQTAKHRVRQLLRAGSVDHQPECQPAMKIQPHLRPGAVARA